MTDFTALGPLLQVHITVGDLERSTAFYRDSLGIPFLFEAPPKMAFFDAGGIRLMLGEAEGEASDRHASILYFAVEDIHGAHERLSERGVRFRDEPHLVHRTDDVEVWLVFFDDPDGNAMALMSEVAVGGG